MAVHHFPPNFTGGAEWEALRLGSGLQARGHHVSIIAIESIDQGPAGGGVTWKDEVYQGLPVRRLFFDLKTAPDPWRWEYDNPWIGDHLRGWFQELHPDVFHLFSGYLMTGRALKVAQEMQIKTVANLVDFWFLCPRISMMRSDGKISTLPIRPERCARCLGEEKRRYRLPGKFAPGLMDAFWQQQGSAIARIEARTQFLKETLNGANAILCASQFLRTMFVEAGIRPERIHQVRQGLDFPPALPKSHSSQLRIGYIGQITEIKGVDVLVKAVRSAPDLDAHVSIYGDTTRFPAYSAYLKKLVGGDPRINFESPFHRQEEGMEVLRNLDVVVVPSIWYENSPNVILEAFATGTPVIASNLGGMAELVDPGNTGLLFQPGDANDLATQLRKIAQDPTLLDHLRSGIAPVQTISQAVDKVIELYQEINHADINRRDEYNPTGRAGKDPVGLSSSH